LLGGTRRLSQAEAARVFEAFLNAAQARAVLAIPTHLIVDVDLWQIMDGRSLAVGDQGACGSRTNSPVNQIAALRASTRRTTGGAQPEGMRPAG
jgi:hypothetical protein